MVKGAKMEVFQLFITATIPVLKVLFITALGSYLALERVNILGEETRKNLNTVIFYLSVVMVYVALPYDYF